MSLLDQIKADIVQITTNKDEYGCDLSFYAPNGQIAQVVGIAGKHHLSLDEMGRPTNSRAAHFSIAESVLIAAGYTVRDNAGEVAIRNHRVDWADSTGITKRYVIEQTFPDETIGLIVCILGSLE